MHHTHRLLALETSFTSLTPTCFPSLSPQTYRADKQEWTYRYSPTGLRKQKRLMRAPQHDSGALCDGIMPWTYYVRGLGGKELVVYQGRQVLRATNNPYCEGAGYGHPTQRLVYLYPVEYRSYGPDGVNVMFVRDANGNMVKTFVETDMQGSIIGLHDAADRQPTYHPFGYPIDAVGAFDGAWTNRTGWLDRERDAESAYGNPTLSLMEVGARKYIPRHGRFASVDELWSVSSLEDPYAYAWHDPVNLADPSGYTTTPTIPNSFVLKPSMSSEWTSEWVPGTESTDILPGLDGYWKHKPPRQTGSVEPSSASLLGSDNPSGGVLGRLGGELGVSKPTIFHSRHVPAAPLNVGGVNPGFAAQSLMSSSNECTLVNNTNHTIWFKPETTIEWKGVSYQGDMAYPLAAGESTDVPIDGIKVHATDIVVYKTPDGFHAIVNANGTVSPLLFGFSFLGTIGIDLYDSIAQAGWISRSDVDGDNWNALFSAGN